MTLATEMPSSSIAIYPREGTETDFQARNAQLRNIAIYPREGTETYPAGIPPRPSNCNLSPRGDGNSHSLNTSGV